jgi:hypothetical protein
MEYFCFPVAYCGPLHVATYSDVIWLEVFFFGRRRKNVILGPIEKNTALAKNTYGAT